MGLINDLKDMAGQEKMTAREKKVLGKAVATIRSLQDGRLDPGTKVRSYEGEGLVVSLMDYGGYEVDAGFAYVAWFEGGEISERAIEDLEVCD